MTKLIVLGLDLSIVSPGIVVLRADKPTPLYAPHIKTHPLDDKHEEGIYGTTMYGCQEARIEFIRKYVLEALMYEPVLTLYEDHAYGMRKQNASTQLHELVGVIKNLLWRGEFLAAPIAPTSVKKTATGNGRADKVEMLEAAREWWPQCPNHDMADAYHLARLALSRYYTDVE